jgi:hypothetical protein
VGGNWTNGGTFTCGDSTVDFTGGGTHQISGVNTFHAFTCDDAGSTLKFEDGVTQTAATCTITGTSVSRITLTRIGSGANWQLSAGTSPAITYCDISYGNSTSYIGWTSSTTSSPNNAEAVAGTTSNFFTGFTWSPTAGDTVWTTGSNWVGGIAPLVSSNAVITINTNTLSNYPLLTVATRVDKITIATSSAILDLAAQNFTAEEIDNSGLLRLQGTQTIQNNASGAVSITNRSGSTVEYYGTGTAVDKFNGSYTNATLKINKSGDSWSTDAVISAAVVSDTSTGTALNLSHNITTTGTQTYAGAVTLGADVVLDSGGAGISFASTIDSDAAATPRSLELKAGTGGVTLGGNIGGTTPLASLEVTGAINVSAASIKTTGDQTYHNAVTFTSASTPSLTLDSSGGSIRGAGKLSGSSLTVTARAGISLTDAANDVEDSVSLTNTAGAGSTGNIVYNSSRGSGNTLTITAVNSASSGNLTVTEASGAIASGGVITGSDGVASLTSANDENITIGHTVSGFARLVLKAGDSSANTSTGNVEINASITVTGITSGPGHTDADSAIYIWANEIKTTSGTPATQTGSGGNIDIWYDTAPDATYLSHINTSGSTYHLHPRHDRHIVYMKGTDPGSINVSDGPLSSGYYYFRSDSNLGTGITLYNGGGKNIYIVDVGDVLPSNARAIAFNGSGGGFIEIKGGYTSSGLLTLNPGSAGLRLNDANINLGANPFDIKTNKNVTLYDSTNTITAAGITLGGTVDGTTAEANNLLLDVSGASASTISVTGPVGGSIRLGDIEVRSTNSAISPVHGVTFTGAVTAKSYTQTGAGGTGGTGSTTFNAAQNYSGVNASGNGFQFTGTALTVNNLTTTAANGPVTITGALTQTSGTITSSDTFTQTSGAVILNGSIITNNATAGNAKITIEGAVTLAGATTMTTPNSTGGDIVFKSTINGSNNLILNGETGKVEFHGAVGNTTRLGEISRNGTGETDVYANVSTNGAAMTFGGQVNLRGNVHFDNNTGAGNIQIAGNIDGNDGTAWNLTLTAGTGNIIVAKAVGTGTDRLGNLTIISAANVNFSDATNRDAIYATGFAQSSGSGTTIFYGPQDYSGAFSFTGNNLTVNNTLNAVGDITVASNATVSFASAAAVTAASFTQQTGTGTTTFNGTQTYTAGFSFNGTNLTVNNTLQTDTDTDGGGAIDITVSGTFTVGNTPGGNIQPGGTGGTLTVTGNTVNNGTITAGPVATGTAIVFDGDYSIPTTGTLGARTINGNATTNPNIVFKGNATFFGFTHNEDTVQFSGTVGKNHNITSISSDKTVTFADVVIDTGNTVTVANGITIIQKNSAGLGNLTLTSNAALVLPTAAVADGSWYIGAKPASPWHMLSNPSPSSTGDSNYINPGPSFTSGFAGLNGSLTMGNGATLTTNDFYTQVTNPGTPVQPTPPSPLPSTNQFTLTAPSGASEMCNIFASGNVTVNESFGNVANSTLTMDGVEKKLAVRSHAGTQARVADVEVGNFVADAGGDGTVVNSDIIVRGNVAITPGSILQAGSSPSSALHIQVIGNWIQAFHDNLLTLIDETHPPISADSTATGNFIAHQSAVEFGDHNLSGGVYQIVGDTTFYELVCYEQKAKLQFSNLPHEHIVSGKFSVCPSTTAYPADFTTESPKFGINNMMTVTRLIDPGLTPPYGPSPYSVPPMTLDDLRASYPAAEPHFWYFNLAPGGELETNWLSLYYSFSSKRVPLPPSSTAASWRVDADPYYDTKDSGHPELGLPADPKAHGSYYSVNWYVGNKFYYGFTEDANGNGRIDRLRLQAAFELLDRYPPNDPNFPNQDALDGFAVEVWDDNGTRYTVTGYERADLPRTGTNPPLSLPVAANRMDCLYVFLEEKPYSDGDAVLHWKIISNPKLRDQATRGVLIGDPGDTDKSAVDDAPDRSGVWDTVKPRINYALTVPGNDERAEIYFQMSEPVDVSSPIVDSVAGKSFTESSFTLTQSSEFIIVIDSPFEVPALAVSAPPKFRLKDTVHDLASPAIDLRNDPTIPYAYRFPPPKYPRDYTYHEYVYVQNRNYSSAGSVSIPNKLALSALDSELEHRVTDVLISVPPDGSNDLYFVWPVWAKYKESSNAGNNNPGYSFWKQTPTDTGIIWEFYGKKYLEDRDIDLQARRNPLLTTDPEPTIHFGLNVSDAFRSRAISAGDGHDNPGLWLPESLSPPPSFVNLVPYFYNSTSRGKSSGADDNYVYSFSKDEYDSPSMLDFLFHLNGTPNDLFAARLDIKPGAPIPSNWYRLVRPFSFEIHDMTRQRSGVTILNNVINPNNGESTYVHYQLVTGGQVTIQVFTLDGTMVDILYRGHRDAGEYRAAWGGKNRGGRAVARGMYFIRVVGPDIDEIRKVMVVK